MFRELETNEMMQVDGGIENFIKAAMCIHPAGAVAVAVYEGVKYQATTPSVSRTTTRGGVKHTVPAYRP